MLTSHAALLLEAGVLRVRQERRQANAKANNSNSSLLSLSLQPPEPSLPGPQRVLKEPAGCFWVAKICVFSQRQGGEAVGVASGADYGHGTEPRLLTLMLLLHQVQDASINLPHAQLPTGRPSAAAAAAAAEQLPSFALCPLALYPSTFMRLRGTQLAQAPTVL